MPTHRSAVSGLRRVFSSGFSARDIAEPLVSFDTSALASDVRCFMEARGFEVVGARRDGLVVGYLQKQDLTDGRRADSVQSFDDACVVDDAAPLSNLVLELKEAPRLFVTLLGSVGGVVTRSDFQKAPVRMWLFGMITLMEMRFTRLIEDHFPGDTWLEHLSESRVQKARELLAERTRRNLQLGLLDCIQFSDKGQIVARNENVRMLTQFKSRRQIEQVFKSLERLRNNLAHAQDIITSDWETIVLLSENLDRILAGPPGLRAGEA